MILYKYYGFSAGLSALKSSKLGFRQPSQFNDPLELTFLTEENGVVPRLKNDVCILSMTRSPLNPLMWAHYGDEHRGFVIGYDVDCELLTSASSNIISVNDGDVIYTSTKTPSKEAKELHLLWLTTQGAPSDETESEVVARLAKKVFLTKHTSWAYEEEVRVVKMIQSLFEEIGAVDSPPNWFETLSRTVAPGMSVSMIPGLFLTKETIKIKEVYLGCRNPLRSANIFDNSNHADRQLFEKAVREEWNVFCCFPEEGTWNLASSKADSSVLLIHQKTDNWTTDISIQGRDFIEAINSLEGHQVMSEDNLSITKFNSRVYVQLNGQFLPK